MHYRDRTCRRIIRVASAGGLTVGLLLASAAACFAAAPGSAAKPSPATTTLLGLPITTAAWAIVGLIALLGGLIVASRSSRVTRGTANAHPTLVESLQATARSGQLRLAEQRSEAQAAS